MMQDSDYICILKDLQNLGLSLIVVFLHSSNMTKNELWVSRTAYPEPYQLKYCQKVTGKKIPCMNSLPEDN